MKLPFDECWLINLVERPDRKEYMFNQFRTLNMDVKYHQAVMGPDWIYKIFCDSINKITNVPGDGFRGEMDVPHAIGCWREHYTLIKSAYLRGLNSIMIIEDDCGFLKNEKLFQKYLDNIPAGWDILRMNYLYGPNHEYLINAYKERNGDALWLPQPATCWGTGCYALSRKAMKYVLDWYDKYFASIDTAIANPYVPNVYDDGRLYNFYHRNLQLYVSDVPLGLCHDENIAQISSMHQNMYDDYKWYNGSIYLVYNYTNINVDNYF